MVVILTDFRPSSLCADPRRLAVYVAKIEALASASRLRRLAADLRGRKYARDEAERERKIKALLSDYMALAAELISKGRM